MTNKAVEQRKRAAERFKSLNPQSQQNENEPEIDFDSEDSGDKMIYYLDSKPIEIEKKKTFTKTKKKKE